MTKPAKLAVEIRMIPFSCELLRVLICPTDLSYSPWRIECFSRVRPLVAGVVTILTPLQSGAGIIPA